MALDNIKGFYVTDEDSGESGVAKLGTDAYADSSVTTAKLSNGAVTDDKLGSTLKTKTDQSHPNYWAVLDDDNDLVEAVNIGGTVHNIIADTVEDGAISKEKLSEDLAEEFDNKADQDGDYDSLTAGGAKQLLSTVYVDDNEPYNFRTAGGSADIGDRMYEEVVGGSIVWNQFCTCPFDYVEDSGVTRTRNNDGSYTFNGTSTKLNNTFTLDNISEVNGSLISNHVYYCKACPSTGLVPASSGSNIHGGIEGFSIDRGNGGLYKHTYTFTSTNLRIDLKEGDGFDNAVIYPQWIDLTQMFGSTIADYIYSLEQGTAGAGVAWFRKLFPKPYYEYNAGELMSVKAGSHDTVGFNAWDEEWELGTLDNATGATVTSSTAIRSKNFIPVVPNANYCAHVGNPSWITECFYDSDKNFISYASTREDVASGNYGVFTTPTNASFMKFRTESGVYGTTYNHDICINLSWDGERNGEYEPYEKHSYPLANIELRGIPKLDANNQLYYDGDTYTSDGTVTRKYGIRAYQSGDELLADAITDAITDGTNTVYKLSTPTTETAEGFTSPQVVNDFGTEEYTDYAVEAGDRDVAIPVGHNSQYMNNLRAKLEMAPDSPSGDGKYIVQQSNGENAYIPYTADGRLDAIEAKLPAPPSANGTYKLTATVTDGGVTYTWVAG